LRFEVVVDDDDDDDEGEVKPKVGYGNSRSKVVRVGGNSYLLLLKRES
jgi:hypothetical protein